MSNNYNNFFTPSHFPHWNFFKVNIMLKAPFKVNISKKFAERLKILNGLGNYGIQFDIYLITVPLSNIIAVACAKNNMPIANFAEVIDLAEKNRYLVSLKITKSEYIFNFEII